MKTSIWSKQFGKALAERALKTLCQSAVAFLAAGATGLIDVDWVQLASVSGLAALVSVLTSIGSGAITDGSPSLSNEKIS